MNENELKLLLESDSSFFDINSQLKLVKHYSENFVPTILFGPPGTSKSWIINKLLVSLEEENKLGNFQIVQFHKKYSYEDFIEGFAPNEKGDFVKKDGSFKSFCKNIQKDKINVFVIDEFNRAELTTTLGEVLYLIEDRKNRKILTSHFGDEFSIPENIFLIGTMNNADRNISNIDFAIRRRFKFIPFFPNYKELTKIINLRGWAIDGFETSMYSKFAKILNSRIATNRIMGRNMQLGHMMFVPPGTDKIRPEDVVNNFVFVILPQIEAYCGVGNDLILEEVFNPHIANLYLTQSEIKYEDIVALVRDFNNEQNDI